MLSLLLSAVLQAPRLDLSTDLPSVDRPFELRAFDGDHPVAAATVDVLDAAGRALTTLHTGADGRAQWAATAAGPFTLRWRAPSGVELLVPLHAVATRRWWWMAAWCLPVGLWLLRAAVRGAGPR